MQFILLSEKEYTRLVLNSARLLDVYNLIDKLDEENLVEKGSIISKGERCIKFDPKDLIVKIKKIIRHPSGKYAAWLTVEHLHKKCGILTFLKNFTARSTYRSC